MKDIIIFEKEGYVNKRVFRVSVAELDDPGFKRSIQHREGFRDVELKRAFAGNKISTCLGLIWYRVVFFIDELESHQSAYEESMKALGRTIPERPTDPNKILVDRTVHDVINIVGMPAFFKEVGFDYSKKKFLPDSPVMKHEQEKNNGDNH